MGCGCVAALYLVSMPARKQDGSFDPAGDKLYYCDANAVGGVLCPEFDIMEANIVSFRSTPHTCDAPSSKGYYSKCDGGGKCAADVQTDHRLDYGPGWACTVMEECYINSEQAFHVKIDFNKGSDGKFNGYTTTMSQFKQETGGSRTIDMQNDCATNFEEMGKDLENGMVFAMSNWESTGIDWLQHGACSGTCPETHDSLLTFSNLKVTTAAGKENKSNDM